MIRLRIIFSLAILLCCLCLQSVAAAPQRTKRLKRTQPCKIINLMPLFLTFWDRAAALDQQSQVQLFKDIVVKPYPEVFHPDVLNAFTELAELDSGILAFLQNIPPHMNAIRGLSQRLPRELPVFQKRFRQKFSDFRCRTPVYFIPSLGSFDGATRTVGGKPALLFGVDVIARIHDDESFEAFFDHELFHIYKQPSRNRRGGGRPPLYVSMWGEGLATYVSHAMNPKVAESKILGRPIDLAQRTAPLLPQIAKELIENVDSTSETTYRTFFMGGGDAASDFPRRSGYYVGYLVAKQLAKRYSLRELAALKGARLRREIVVALRRMADAN